MVKKVKTKRVKKSARRIMVFGVVSCFICIFQIFTITKLVMEVIDKSNELNKLDEEFVLAVKTSEEKNKFIDKLKDPEYKARYVREKYFYSKDNEYNFRFFDE